jgi:RimJ/RimL family protein N-acetyltransferase
MKPQSASYRIRQVKKSDIPGIIKLRDLDWPGDSGWMTKGIVTNLIRDNPRTCWIMEIGGKTIGARIVCDDFEKRAWGWTLMISPEYKRKGYGTLLFNDTNRILKRMGYRCLFSVCDPTNVPSRNWHKKMGHKTLCVLPKWFFDDTDASLFYYKF